MHHISAFICQKAVPYDRLCAMLQADTRADQRAWNSCGWDSTGGFFDQVCTTEKTGKPRHIQVGMGSSGPLSSLGPFPNRLVWDGYLSNRAELENLLPYDRDFLSSDAALALAAYQHWGVDCFSKFKGGFSIVLYDVEKQCLICARDPMGLSPLYYEKRVEGYFFSASIRGLIHSREGDIPEVNESAVADFLLHGLRDVGHQTFYQGIYSLPNGHWARIELSRGQMDCQAYWELPRENSFKKASSITRAAVAEQLRTRLVAAVGAGMAQAGRVGLTLSGGMDSSAVAAAYLQLPEVNASPLMCYTVQYNDFRFDEIRYARAMTDAFPGRLQLQITDGNKMPDLAALDAFLVLAEEPFHDPVHLIEYRQLQAMRQAGIDTYLSGIGGDDVLAGFDGLTYKPLIYKYLFQKSPLRLLEELPFVFRSETRHTPFSVVRRLMRGRLKKTLDWSVLQQMPQGPERPVSGDLYERMRAILSDRAVYYALRGQKFARSLNMSYRFPFLDPQLVECCLQIPPEHWMFRGVQKQPLRMAFQGIIPELILRRYQKTGFPFDTQGWLRVQKGAWEVAIGGVESPWLSGKTLIDSYDHCLETDPQALWRMLVFLRWYGLRKRL